MAELERDLRALAAHVELPAGRDLVPSVRARLTTPARASRRRTLIALVVGLAAAVGVAFAVPPARSTILRFLGLEGVTIVRVESLPPAGGRPGSPGGRRVSLAEAMRMLVFQPLLPDIGRPDAIFVDQFEQLLVVVYGKDAVRLRLSELAGRRGLYSKMVTVEQRVEPVDVGGDPGIWVEGQHVVSELYGTPRLSGNALLWEHAGLTLRLEGHLSKQQALRIARSVQAR